MYESRADSRHVSTKPSGVCWRAGGGGGAATATTDSSWAGTSAPRSSRTDPLWLVLEVLIIWRYEGIIAGVAGATISASSLLSRAAKLERMMNEPRLERMLEPDESWCLRKGGGAGGSWLSRGLAMTGTVGEAGGARREMRGSRASDDRENRG